MEELTNIIQIYSLYDARKFPTSHTHSAPVRREQKHHRHENNAHKKLINIFLLSQ